MKIDLEYLIKIIKNYKYLILILSLITSISYCFYYYNDKILIHEIEIIVEHKTTPYIEEYKSNIKELDNINYNLINEHFQQIKSYSVESFHKKFNNNILYEDFIIYSENYKNKLNFIDINELYNFIEFDYGISGLNYRIKKPINISPDNKNVLSTFLKDYYQYVDSKTIKYFSKIIDEEFISFNKNKSQNIKNLYSAMINEHLLIVLKQIYNLKSNLTIYTIDNETLIQNIMNKYNKLRLELSNLNEIYILNYSIPEFNYNKIKDLDFHLSRIGEDLENNLKNSDALLLNFIQNISNQNKRYSLYNSINLQLFEISKILDLHKNMVNHYKLDNTNELVLSDIFINIKPQTHNYGIYIDIVLFFIIVFIFSSFFFVFILLNLYVFFINKE